MEVLGLLVSALWQNILSDVLNITSCSLVFCLVLLERSICSPVFRCPLRKKVIFIPVTLINEPGRSLDFCSGKSLNKNGGSNSAGGLFILDHEITYFSSPVAFSPLVFSLNKQEAINAKVPFRTDASQ